MAPFVDRCAGPTWFRNIYPDVTPKATAMSNSLWSAFFTPTLLSTRIKTGTDGYGFNGYHPNLVARQFGSSQMFPCSLYSWEDDICWSERKFTLREYRECMAFARQQILELPTFCFQPSLVARQFGFSQ